MEHDRGNVSIELADGNAENIAELVPKFASFDRHQLKLYSSTVIFKSSSSKVSCTKRLG